VFDRSPRRKPRAFSLYGRPTLHRAHRAAARTQHWQRRIAQILERGGRTDIVFFNNRP
jgi:hypothetical protein